MLGCALMLPSCQTAPNYPVNSYDEIKEALADQPDIIYPDISRYENSDLIEYVVTLYEKDRRIRTGYTVWTPDSPYVRKLYLEADTVLANLGIDCSSLEFYSKEDKAFHLQGTTPEVYRTLTLYTYEREDFWYKEEDRLGDGPNDIFPLGTRAGNIGYIFDFNGYRYFLSGKTSLLPEEQTDITYDERMTQAKDELLALVDSILDQGGVVK
jgi:hypothetical protein